MAPTPRRAIAWFRRDLRLADNRMLEAATRDAERVWPVFVVDPGLLERNAAARNRIAWYGATVGALAERLRAVGSGLTVLAGPPERALGELAAQVGAEAVYAAGDEDPDAVERDARVARALDLRLVDDARIVPPAELRTGTGEAYAVYSPFRRALDDRVWEAPELRIGSAEADLGRLAPPARPDGFAAFPGPEVGIELPPAGEKAAADRLRAFLCTDLHAYPDERDRPARGMTSRLSPYLRVGAISARACWRAAVTAAERGLEHGDERLARAAAAWRGELAWREFFAHVLAAHPRVARESFRRAYDGLEWVGGHEGDELLDAWRQGRTGYPFVDAGVRELVATGWMHNRARLVTASFLVKDLGLDWRRGEAVFAERLIDADTQQNGGNWQWVAGVGTDAAPYFRIFNPTIQARRFDPDGSYIRRWVPELADVPDEHIHEPWRAPSPPIGYPPPIVDHADARRRALARYRAVDAGRG